LQYDTKKEVNNENSQMRHMDAFVKNPLVASIPAELNGSSTNALSRRYITNPLVN